MELENNDNVTLASLRKNQHSFGGWMHKHCPWLFNIHSLFFYFWFIFLVGVLWMGVSLVNNSGTQLYGWDYQSQYVTFAYNFWDTWHNFFKTGVFQLYDTSTFLGADSIGSNSYYGLFDPFLFICYLFPRAWIPQTFALATIIKGCVAALAARAYVHYLGCSENSSRLGGLAYAFTGYTNFMVGFPSFVSMAFCVPLVMLGIDKVIKERKPATLIFGLFFLGMISFFFLVVVCIWGVLYALWRYFWTIKTRNAKENWSVIGLGILSFALGILMASWTLFPSIRESSLTGRTVSIGSAYLSALKTAFKDQNIAGIFSLLFEMVGDNPGRELQGLIGFFYPTCNYLYLPLEQSASSYQYDAWTASLFCYTPCVILFFIALVSSIRRKEWSHLIAFAVCSYFLFTNFAYFFFYAFTGDGYGRWYIVLVPLIIYYACQELDRLKKEPKWVPAVGAFSALAMTILTFVLTYIFVSGKTFEIAEEGTYWISQYNVPGYVVKNGITYSLLWMVYYEIGLDVVVSVVIFIFRNKEWLWKILAGFIAVETIISGNLSFVYDASYSYVNSYNGGVEYSTAATEAFSAINSADSTYYRSYIDGLPEENSQNAFGFNGTSTFHSLFNYDVATLARYSHCTNGESTGEKYGSTYYKKSWSAYYGNKRFAFDQALSMKYYAIKNEGYGSYEAVNYEADNVPFGSTLVYGDSSSFFRVYENPYVEAVPFGHAVDHLYAAGSNPTSLCPDADNFYSGYSTIGELIRNEETYLDGAIINDDDVSKMESENLGLSFETTPTSDKMKRLNCSEAIYNTTSTYYGPYDTATETYLGPTYFLSHADDSSVVTGIHNQKSVACSFTSDTDKLVLTPTSGTYFNTDTDGAYFLLNYSGDKTRIYFVGDRTNADGSVTSDTLLSYDYQSIATYQNRKVGSGGNLFGFYPAGRVKYIVLCGKPSDQAITSVDSLSVYMCERSVIDDEMEKLEGTNYNLSNVNYSTDNFTFTSDFASKRLVVTSLGYDAGWKIKATDSDGSVSYPDVYQLDGGFVGFVAPEGDVSYQLYYETPYLNLGIIASMGSVALFALYEGIHFVCDIRKERKALALDGKRK